MGFTYPINFGDIEEDKKFIETVIRNEVLFEI